MKKYFAGIFALVLAVGTLAFSNAKVDDPMYWFKFNGSNFEWDRHDLTPSVDCTPVGFNNCAIGFEAEPTPDGEGGYLLPTDPPDVEKKKQ